MKYVFTLGLAVATAVLTGCQTSDYRDTGGPGVSTSTGTGYSYDRPGVQDWGTDRTHGNTIPGDTTAGDGAGVDRNSGKEENRRGGPNRYQPIR